MGRKLRPDTADRLVIGSMSAFCHHHLGPTIDRPPSFHRARPIVCRFVPHDQWLLTHVPLYWKGKDIKHHLLAKCLNLSCPPPDPPTRFTASQGLASGGGLEERPPSPITFAPDPLDRPPSPILFAATTPTRFLHAPDDNDAESEGEDEGEDDDGDAETLDDTASRIEGGEGKGKGRLVDDDGVGIGGARVVPTSSTGRIHHKGSASSGLNSLSNHASSASFGVSFAPSIDSRSTLVNGVAAPSIPDGRAVPPTAHLSFSLVRFATGQIIEDEYPLSDYDVSPHELLELHLSIAPLSPDHHHSLSSVAGYLPPTPTFPFPLIPSPAPRKLKGKKKKAAAALMHAGGTRLVALPRTVCERYAEPYWEGWIRILRFSCRDEEDYMYGGSGGGRGKGAGEGKADKGAGPGFAQYGAASLDGWGHSGNQILGEAREREVDGMLGRDAIVGFGFGGLPNKATGRGSGRATAGESAPRSRFEWRERWVIIRDGWIFLLKERGDPTPSHSFPLRNLVNLRDADHLTASLDSAKDRRMRAGKDQVRSTRAKEGHGYDAERYRREKDRLQSARAVPSTGGSLPSPTSTIKPSPHEAQRSVSRSQGHSHSHSQSWVAAEEGTGGPEEAGGTRPATASAHACKPHPHSQSSSSATRPANATTASSGRPVVSRDPRDALARYHASPRTFVPSNKEEADLVGMRIVCAKFRQASAREREGVPDPFSGVLDHAAGEDGGVMKRLYTSTAPSLADVQGVGVGIAAGLIQGGFLDPEWDKEGRGVEKEGRYEQRTRAGGAEREKDRPRDREREKAERDKAARDALRASERQLWEDVNWISPARRSKARDKDKGKTGSKGELASFGGLGSADARLIAADRRPSLPTFASSAGSVSGDGHTLVSASSSMSLMSIFTGRGGGEKEDKKREKKREKEGRKRDKEEKKRQQDMDSVGVTSSGSWYLGRRKGTGGGNARRKESPQITESSGALHLPDNRDNASTARDVDMDSDEGSSPSVEGSDMNHGPPSQVNQFEGVEAPARVQNQVSFQSANQVSDSDSDDPTSPVFAREDDDDGDSDLDFVGGVSPKRHELNRAPIGHPDAHSTGQELSGSTAVGLPDVREEGTSSPAGHAHPPLPVPTTSGTHRARSASVTTASTVKNRHPTVRKPEPLKGQWIIMDLGSDAAYHSLLRILHRSLGQPLASSFLQALPGLAISSSPVTPLARDYNPRRSNSLLHLGSPSSPSRIRSLSDATHSLGQTRYAADDASRTATPVGGSIQHPPQLDTLVRDHLSRSQVIGRTLGALPYPEWRHDIVMRSQRAGLGVVARPLEIILFAMGEKRQEGYYFDDPCLVVRQPEPEPIRIQGSPRVENDTSLTPVESDDGSYEDKEVLVLDENSSDESEMEWQAWHVDLDRQYQAQREKRDIVATNPPPPQSSVLALDQDKSEDDNLELLPTSTAEERVLATKKRHDHGPCGVITSLYTSTALQGFAAPQDGVHEHHEDAAHRRAHQSHRKWMPAAAHGLTSRSLIAEHPRASSGNDQGTYSHGTLSSGYLQPPLRHSSSMQSSLFAPSDGWSASHEGPVRQPSLTALGGATTTTTTTEQSFTLTPNSFGMAIRELKGQDGSDDHGDDHRGPQAQYVTDSAPGSPVSHHHSPSSASLLSGSPPPSSILRHHLPSSSSVGLAASPIKPNVLRKKTSARDFEGEAVMANARGRPALTVSTSAPLAPRQLELVEADRRAKPAAKSPTGANVQGDSEFKSEDEHQLTSPKKKKSGTFERFVRAF